MVCSLENLPGLVQKTRTEEGRKEILSNETHSMHKLSLSLKHFGPQPDVETEDDVDKQLDILRVFRNLLANGRDAADLVVACGLEQACVEIVVYSKQSLLRKVALQVLANLSNQGGVYTRKIQDAFSPQSLKIFVQEGTGIAPEVVHTLFANLCKESEDFAVKLSEQDILRPILEKLALEEVKSDVHLEILLISVCICGGQILGCPPMMQNDSFQNPEFSDISERLPTIESYSKEAVSVVPENVVILTMIVESLENGRILDHLRGKKTNLVQLAFSLLIYIQILAKKTKETLSKLEVAFLRECLKFWRTISGLEDTKDFLGGERCLLDLFLNSDYLIKTLLSMLASLGRVPSRRPDKSQMEQPPLNFPRLEAELYCQEAPYEGYRTDSISVLANCCYRRQIAQNQVQDLGGIELILENCQVDDGSPFLREAGLWCIRNLCEGNLEIQKQIEDLKIVDVVDSPELQNAGVRLEHEAGSGKVSVVKRDTNRK